MSNIINKVERKIVPLQKLAAIIAVISAIGGGYLFYIQNKAPVIKIINADYEKVVAHLTINNKPKVLYRSSVLHAGGNWGVQMTDAPNRIELTKNGMVTKIIAQS